MKIGTFGRARNIILFRARPVFLFVLAVLSLAAQTPELSAGFEDAGRIRVDVRVVVLHISVWNKRGEVVSGLKRENLKTARRVSQPVGSFRPKSFLSPWGWSSITAAVWEGS
jgi:hypothetical protein